MLPGSKHVMSFPFSHVHTCTHSDSGVGITEDTRAKRLAPKQPQPGGAMVAVVEDRLSL